MEDFSRGGTMNRRSGVDIAALQQAHMVAGNVPVVPERESLRSSTNIAGSASGSITPKTNEHFFVKAQPPAALPPFQEQAAKVQQVIQTHAPELAAATKASVGTSVASPGKGLATTDVSGQQSIHISIPPEAQKTVQVGAAGGKPAAADKGKK